MNEYLIDVKYSKDDRGSLGIFEQNGEYLNKIKRFFWITVNKENQIRGEHAHKSTSQLMICVTGKILIECYDQNDVCTKHVLEQSGKALLVPPMIWSTQKYVTSASSLMVICDEYFHENEYIRNKSEFLKHRHLAPKEKV